MAVLAEPVVAASALDALASEPTLRPLSRGPAGGSSSSWSKGPWEADGVATASSSRAASRDVRPQWEHAGDAFGRMRALDLPVPRTGSPAPLSARRKIPQEVEQMVGELDQRVAQISQVESSRIRMMMDQAQKLVESLQSMRVQRELQEERRQQELRFLENNVQQDLAKSSEDRRDFQLRLEERSDKFFQERHEALRRLRGSAPEQDTDTCNELAQRLGHEVYRIGGSLEEQRDAREEYGERIQASLQAEFQKVEDAVLAERDLRHEAQHTMQRMVQDVCMRIHGEVQQERETREAVQGRLLGLLEETCSRIEVSFGGSPGAQSLSLSASLGSIRNHRAGAFY